MSRIGKCKLGTLRLVAPCLDQETFRHSCPIVHMPRWRCQIMVLQGSGVLNLSSQEEAKNIETKTRFTKTRHILYILADVRVPA